MTKFQESDGSQIIGRWSHGEVEVEEHADDGITAKSVYFQFQRYVN